MSINIKLCGNRSFSDLQTTSQSGAHYLGVVFAESKRQVQAREVKEWIQTSPLQSHQKLVGVFVNPTLQELDEVFAHVNLDVIQLHGHEQIPHVLHIKEKFGCTVWKAIHHTDSSLDSMKLFKGIIDGFVVDAKSDEAWGGTGEQFDWGAVPSYIEEAESQGVPCFIAGGVTPENVTELAKLRPHGIDVSSGIETNQRKDKNKIELMMRRSNHVRHIS